MCRSARIHVAVGERVGVGAPAPRRRAEPAVERVELGRDGGEALRLGRRARLARPSLAQRRRPRRAARRPRPRARAARATPCGAAIAQPAAAASSRSRAEPVERRHEDRRLVRGAARARAPLAAGADVHAVAQARAGSRAAPTSGFVRSSDSLPARELAQRPQRPRARAARSPGRQLDDDQRPLRGRPEQVACRRRARRRGSRPESARRAAAATSSSAARSASIRASSFSRCARRGG